MKQSIFQTLTGTVCLVLGAVCGTAADLDYVENTAFTNLVTIAVNGTTATVVNPVGTGVTYVQNGAGLVFTSTVAGVEYVVSGTSSYGHVRIASDYAAKVTLSGANLTSTNGPAVAVLSTNRSFVVLAEGTTNVLCDSTVYSLSGDGTLYASGPMILSGRGSLTVTGKKKHGIYAAAYLRVLGGDITVNGAVKDGIHTIQYFMMDNGSLNIAATGDAVDADVGYAVINGGSLNALSTTDDTKGVKCDGPLTVNGGAINMTLKGVQSKGFKSAGNIAINGGTLMFNLSGGPYLETLTNTFVYVDPSYCTGIKGDSNITVTAGNIIIHHTGVAGKGVSADGNITITGGKFDIVTTGGCSASFTNDSKELDVAAADCLKADGNLQILGGTINAMSTGNAGDGISAEGYAIIGVLGVSNTPVINVATRGQKVYLTGSGQNADYSNPKAFKAVGNLIVNGGIFTASTKNDGGEGLESKANLTINGGTLEITAYDDCINASTSITINGGLLYCYSSGNDAIDSNGTFRFTGGTIVASGTTAPEEGFDCDQNNFAISGGILVGTGGATSTPTAASCTQRSVIYKGTGTAGTIIQVKSTSGNNLVYKVPRSYSGGGMGGMSGMVMLFSNPSLASGTSYSIVTGATVTGGTEFHGLYTGATVTGGTTVKTFTPTSMVTTVQ